MRFTSALVLTFAALASFATSSIASTAVNTGNAGENPITYPLGDTIKAGTDITITWIVTLGKSCNLVLRMGKDTDLDEVLNIAIDTPNTGAFTWSVPLTLVAGDDYSIQIVAGDNDNYSPMFTVSDGTSTLSPSTTSPSSSASSSAISTSSNATTTSASAFTTATISGASNSSSTMRTSTRPNAAASYTPTTQANSVNDGVHHASSLTLILSIFAGFMYLS